MSSQQVAVIDFDSQLQPRKQQIVDADGFQLVSSKSRNMHTQSSSRSEVIEGVIPEEELKVDHIQRQITEDYDLIWNSQLFRDLIRQLSQITRKRRVNVLCLGLGSLHTKVSKCQLCLLNIICYRLDNIEFKSAFDPHSASLEFLSQQFGFTQLQNQMGSYALDGCIDSFTICFMPHCPLQLYDNLIKVNYKSSNYCIIGNNLKEYHYRSHDLQSKAKHVYDWTLDQNYSVQWKYVQQRDGILNEAFSDFCLQLFN